MSLTITGSPFYFGRAADAQQVALPEFYAWLKSVGSDKQWPYIPKQANTQTTRQLFCDIDASHFFGVFVSARQAEFQHYVRRDGGHVIIEAASTEGKGKRLEQW